MRVLLTGASGFIGREVFAALAARGHEVVPAVRRPGSSPAFAKEPEIVVDMNRDVTVEAWRPRLQGIDAVVNCAGILQGSRTQSIEAIHSASPIALFEACREAGVKRVVQVSAISAEPAAGTAYAKTKRAADDHLRSMPLEWVVVRPSLVVAQGSYGGTSALRALAALPFAIPLPGDGKQAFQPIWIGDLCDVIAMALESATLVHRTVDPVGPERVELRELLVHYRRWLGFAPVRVAPVPMGAVRLACAMGDAIGAPVNSTSLAQLEHGNAGDYESFHRATGIAATGWEEGLARHPAQSQDRWHARLYFLRPLLRLSLSLLWLASGFLGLASIRGWAPLLAQDAHLPVAASFLGVAAACILDVAFAILITRRWRPRTLAMLQLIAIGAYTLCASVLWPSLWAETLGPLLKNLPVMVAVLVLGAIEEER